MNASATRRRGAAAAAAGLGALYILAARGTPVGAVEDDALHLLLARSLRHGAFALAGTPLNDPLPGFAAFLAMPEALVQPHWDLLKIVGLASAAAVVVLTWRLAKRFLNNEAAAAAAALTAVSPLVLSHAGVILPDLPYLALSLLLFERLGQSGLVPLIVAAVAASLLRPYGAWLILSLALGLGAAKGARKAAAFAVPALLPLALWSWRNALLTGAGSGYLLNLRAETAALAEPGTAFRHAAGLLAALGGDGLLSLGRLLPFAGLAAAGASALAAAGFGAVRLLKEKKDPRVLAMAAYAILLCAQHLVWMPIEVRYVLPLLPLAWILLLAAGARLPKRARAIAFALLAVPALLSLRLDFALAAPGLHGVARFQPATMAWLKDNTPENAVIQSMEPRVVTLFTGRDAELPALQAGERDAWLAAALARKISFIHVVSTFAPGGYFPPEARRAAENLERWAASTPYAREVHRDSVEGTAVFALVHPDPARYLKAWAELAGAASAVKRGETPASARAQIDRALALEPRLALAWVLRAGLEPDPKIRRRFLDKAGELDSSLLRSFP